MLGQLGQFAVTPHLKPRDAVDVIVGLPLGLLAVAELNIAPTLVLFIALHLAGAAAFADIDPSGELGLLLSAGVAILFFIAFGVLIMLHGVTRLELDAAGIRFVRLLGWPRFVPWSEIKDISPATRKEVFLHAWLWPPWPRREPTASLTALGHFRIVFGNHVRYFPPSNPEEFALQVRNFLSEVSNLDD